jgi:hypothetical protein
LIASVKKIEPRLRSVLRRIPPRVSLLTGAVFVLVTLYMPLAVGNCGHCSGTGRDIVQAKPDLYWPSPTAFFTDSGSLGRWFYLFLLAWAAVAIALAFISLVNRGILGRCHFLKALLVAGGAASFLLLADYSVAFVVFAVRGLGFALIGFYTIVPLLVWYRLALWPGRGSPSHWLAVRRRSALIYLPTVAGQFLAASEAIKRGAWGLIPCLVGVHLTTLGYMRLAQQAEAAQTTAPAGAIRPAIAAP